MILVSTYFRWQVGFDSFGLPRRGMSHKRYASEGAGEGVRRATRSSLTTEFRPAHSLYGPAQEGCKGRFRLRARFRKLTGGRSNRIVHRFSREHVSAIMS